MKAYPIHECFYTWQGEGVHLGRAAYFIRTYGCPLQCAWCDAAGTWHPDYVPENVERITADLLAERAAATAGEFTVITGGEPTIFDLEPLTRALHEKGMSVHLETSGAFPIRGDFDWITLSPKWARLPLRQNVERADELKVIVDQPDAVQQWIGAIGSWIHTRHVWLHPEWSLRDDPRILEAINSEVKAQGAPFRAGWQIHKLYEVDSMDSASRPPAPLGGDPSLGF